METNENVQLADINQFAWVQNKDVQIIIKRMQGLDWYFVGGCVRDSLLNIHTDDIDITTTAKPQEIIKRMEGLTIATIGVRFGTVGVFINNWKFEITTTRYDVNPNGRHTTVDFTATFYDDSCRRDFTINALLFNGREIVDYHGGLKDLKNRKVRFIGNAIQRIQEDYLRIIRYIRFFYRFSTGPIEYKEEIAASLTGLHHISKERFLSEITSICKCEARIVALETLNQLELSYNMFSMSLNTVALQSVYDCGFKENDFIYATLFVNGTKEQLANIPLSRWAKKMIFWLQDKTDIIEQLSHLYNIDRYRMLFVCAIKNMELYHILKNATFDKMDTSHVEPHLRGKTQDKYIGEQIKCLRNGG